MNLKGRNFLTLKDFTPEEILYLLDLSAELKAKKKAGELHEYYKGKNIALIFEKTSTRTRCAFEVAAHDVGMGKHLSGPFRLPDRKKRKHCRYGQGFGKNVRWDRVQRLWPGDCRRAG